MSSPFPRAAAAAAAPDLLLRIAARRRERLAEAGQRDAGALDAGQPVLESGVLGPGDNPFLAALANRPRAGAATAGAAAPATPAIIAEVKMGSPRLGSLQGRVDPIAQARLYAANGAAALSVVVEPDFFFGSYELLAA
ncbi:MAG TPA: hypothetical protein VHB47_14940, partial [Thermoanaerobaculia bacterium]|nr:hypothetical protein [Thermoanaerobaculia bacterium]